VKGNGLMAKKKIKDIAAELLTDFLSEKGLELFNVEFVKEGRDRYLRVYIDKPESADGEEAYVDIEECELVSRYLSERLDEEDPIAENYILEVSSPGLDRPLIKEDDYRRYAGRQVDVKLYKAVDGRKQFTAPLIGLADGVVSFKDEKGEGFEIPLEQISKINLSVII
jgi:ribosome maturation factor RimP